MLKIYSKGVLKVPHLDAFLKEERAACTDPERVEMIAGWGYKPTAAKARAMAQRLDVPYLALEDGMLRSLDLGVNGAPPLSISVDPVGCYYSCEGPSLIEHLMADGEWFNEALAERTARLIEFLKRHALSKYNCQPAFNEHELKEHTGARVLLVDQCAGDASLSLGRVSADAAQQMLKTARELYPYASFYLQVHPDVAAGRRQGLFDLNALPADIKVLSSPCAPFTLLPYFTALFTGSSQLGFEALLQGGISVHCAGLPFYAGYGLTDDLQECIRRKEIDAPDVSLLKLAAAVYFKLCRYVNPISGERCEAEEAAAILACQREVNEQNSGLKVVYNVKRWKRPILAGFLQSTAGRVEFIRAGHGSRAVDLCAQQDGTLVQWASKRDKELIQAAAEAEVKQLFVEDGFIRSVGLGSNHYRPFSLVFDSLGIYYDPSCTSKLEQILNALPERADLGELKHRAAALIAFMVAGGITKYNLAGSSKSTEALEQIKAGAKGRPIVLVPGQVESDASVQSAGGEIRTNAELLRRVKADHPDACIVYKPHPDVVALNRRGIGAEQGNKSLADFTVTDLSIADLYELADEICVLSSQSGFEALLRGRKVTVYGRPFYAGWGLTSDKQSFKTRTARLSLEALAAGVLILYPRYFDWVSGQFCRPEDICWRLEHLKGEPRDGLLVRAARGAYQARRIVYRMVKGDLND